MYLGLSIVLSVIINVSADILGFDNPGIVVLTRNTNLTEGVPRMVNRGGSVLSKLTNVYPIYYGAQFSTTQKDYIKFLNDALAGLAAGTNWYDEATSFADNIGPLKFSPSNTVIINDYRYGKQMTDVEVDGIVRKLIKAKKLKDDKNGIYIVFADTATTNGIDKQANHVTYNGYHSIYIQTINEIPDAIPDETGKIYHFPNGGAKDFVVSALLHEITETVTNPDPLGINAWVSDVTRVIENGDMCAWKIPIAKLVPNDPKKIYNLKMGGNYYLVQVNYNDFDKACPARIYED